MPNEVVWVDKILNPRSVVLTYNEAMNVLKKAKAVSGRSQFTTAECKPSSSNASVKIEDQKEECLRFLSMHADEMETKPLIKMHEELQSIAASKIAFNKAVNKKLILADGLPRLKPSTLLKKDILRNQKDKKKSKPASKLVNIASSAINKEAVKNLFHDKDDDQIVVLSSSESETNEIEEPAIKRKRIVISDDEDINDDAESETPIISTKKDTVQSIPETVSQKATDGDIFKQAFISCSDATSNDPITITFEADDSGVNVIASSSNVQKIIDDEELPPNSIFSDKTVSTFLNKPNTSQKSSDEALQHFLFGKIEEQPGKLSLSNKNKVNIPNMDLIQKLSYSELVKDDKFCSKLLNTVESDIDVTPFFDMEVRKDTDKSGFLPRQSILNSLFTVEDMEMMEYKNEMEKMNSNRVREKQRIQHPFVKIRPRLNWKPTTVQKSYVRKTCIDPKPKEIDYGIKSILKKFNGNDTNLAQISMKNQLISHNTVIHEAMKYLLKNKSTQKTPDETEAAYKKLSKYPLTFLEKFNLFTTMPKNLSGILCLLDDLGLRFNNKEKLEELEKDCISLFGNPATKETDNDDDEEEEESDLEGVKKVRFSKTVEHRFM